MTHTGMRDFTARNTDGNRLSFGMSTDAADCP